MNVIKITMVRQKQQIQSNLPYKKRRFLPTHPSKRLQSMIPKEKNAKKQSMLKVCLCVKEGMNRHEISKQLKIAYTTVCTWVDRVTQLGINAIYDFVQPGKRCKLDELQQKRLQKDLDQSPTKYGFGSEIWSVKIVQEHIRRKYNVTYERSAVWYLLRRLGLTYRKPRPKHPDSASNRQQKRFKEKANTKIIDYVRHGFRILCEDEASKIINKDLVAGWYRKGRKVEKKVTLSRRGFVMFGTLSEDTFYCTMYDHANSDNFIDHLRRVYKREGKFVMFVDNAAYHKSEKVKRFLEEMNGEIILEYFLPYTPQLNPVEVQWRVINKAVANTYHETEDEMMDQIEAMMKNGEIEAVKMFEYLMVQ